MKGGQTEGATPAAAPGLAHTLPSAHRIRTWRSGAARRRAAAEWTPARWRSLAIAVVIVGVPVGGMIGAALARWIVPAHEWRAVFLVGAISPVTVLALALPWLPESPKFLVMHPTRHRRLARALNRLRSEPALDGSEEFTVSESAPASRGTLVGLVRAPYLATTLLLWTAFSCNTLAPYRFANWLPTALSASGMPLRAAIGGSIWFNFGGILGSVGGSALIGMFGSRRVVIASGPRLSCRSQNGA